MLRRVAVLSAHIGCALMMACGSSSSSTDAGPDVADVGPQTGFEPFENCGPAFLPSFQNPCGEERFPCTVLLDQQIAEPVSGVRNHRPAIATVGRDVPYAPRMILSENRVGSLAYFESGELTVTPIGLPTAVASLTIGGGTFLAADDGATNVTLYEHEPDGSWRTLTTLTNEVMEPGRLHGDMGGCLYVMGSSFLSGRMNLYQWNGSELNTTSVGREGVSFVGSSALALAMDGTPHVLWGEIPPSSSNYDIWWSDGTDARIVHRDVAWTGRGPRMEMVVTPPGVGPDSAYVLYDLGGPLTGLFYATQQADGTFVTTQLEARSTYDGCDPSTGPAAADARCDYTVVMHRPLALLSSISGDIRMAYLRIEEQAELTASCSMFPGEPEPECTWTGEPTRASSLVIAWPGADSGSTVVTTDLQDARGSGVLGAGGMHFVLYERDAATGGDAVRYLAVGF